MVAGALGYRLFKASSVVHASCVFSKEESDMASFNKLSGALVPFGFCSYASANAAAASLYFART
jgi:hypothetical protein